MEWPQALRNIGVINEKIREINKQSRLERIIKNLTELEKGDFNESS